MYLLAVRDAPYSYTIDTLHNSGSLGSVYLEIMHLLVDIHPWMDECNQSQYERGLKPGHVTLVSMEHLGMGSHSPNRHPWEVHT